MIALWAIASAWAVDLDEARRVATEHAVEVERAEAATRAASGARWQAASGALPNVQLFATASTGAGLTAFGFERPVNTQLSAGITGSWTVVAPSSWAAADAARHTERGARAMLAWARVQARRDATVAVADLWAADAEVMAREQAAADAEQAAQGVRSLVDSGLRPPADGARARATAATLQALAVDARGQVAGRCAALQALLRQPVDGRCALTPPEVTEAGVESSVHPALVAADEALRAARADRTASTLGRVPTVTATGTAGQYVAGDNAGLGWSAGVDARLPLLSGGSAHGSDRTAMAVRDDAELALEAQELSLSAAAVSADSSWRASLAALDALVVASDAADQALVLVEARYLEGLEGIEAWQSARRARDDAQVALARGRAQQLRALAELEWVRGVD